MRKVLSMIGSTAILILLKADPGLTCAFESGTLKDSPVLQENSALSARLSASAASTGSIVRLSELASIWYDIFFLDIEGCPTEVFAVYYMGTRDGYDHFKVENPQYIKDKRIANSPTYRILAEESTNVAKIPFSTRKEDWKLIAFNLWAPDSAGKEQPMLMRDFGNQYSPVVLPADTDESQSGIDESKELNNKLKTTR